MEGYYKTKKQLKESVGKGLKVHETSMHGLEYKSDGWLTIEGPAHSMHTWYAQVLMKDDLIVRVK
jgi:hypothetical protein